MQNLFGQISQHLCRNSNDSEYNKLATKDSIEHLKYGNDCILSVIRSIVARSSEKDFGDGSQTPRRILTVVAAILQGVTAVENCIFGAQYVQAATLVRQEMESVEILRNLLTNKFREKVAPKLQLHRKFQLGRVYGQLTGIAHLSDTELLSVIVGGFPVSLDPTSNIEVERVLLSLHIFSLAGCALCLADGFPYEKNQPYSVTENKHATLAMAALCKEGVIPPLKRSTDH